MSFLEWVGIGMAVGLGVLLSPLALLALAFAALGAVYLIASVVAIVRILMRRKE